MKLGTTRHSHGNLNLAHPIIFVFLLIQQNSQKIEMASLPIFQVAYQK